MNRGLLALLVPPVFGLLAGFDVWRTIEGVVATAELIVVARLENAQVEILHGSQHGRGQLEVVETVRGRLGIGERLEFVWVCRSVDAGSYTLRPADFESQERIWMLQSAGNGLWTVLDADQIMPLDNLRDVKRAADESPYFLRYRRMIEPGSSVEVDLVFTNDTDSDMVGPWVIRDGADYSHHPDVSLQVSWIGEWHYGDAVLREDLEFKWAVDSDAVVELSPDQQVEVTLDLGLLLGELRPGTYHLTLATGSPDQERRPRGAASLVVLSPDGVERERLIESGEIGRRFAEQLPAMPVEQARYELMAIVFSAHLHRSAIPALYESYFKLDRTLRSDALRAITYLDTDEARRADFFIARVEARESDDFPAALSYVRTRSLGGTQRERMAAALAGLFDHPDEVVRERAARSVVGDPVLVGLFASDLERMAETDPSEGARDAARAAVDSR